MKAIFINNKVLHPTRYNKNYIKDYNSVICFEIGWSLIVYDIGLTENDIQFIKLLWI